MANVSYKRKVKNMGTGVIATHGYVFLPKQCIWVDDKDWFGKAMWKNPNLKAEVKGQASPLTNGESDMIKYAIGSYNASTKEATSVVIDGVEYAGKITYYDDIPMIYFKEIGVTPQVAPTSVSLSLTKTTLASGEATTGTATVSPSNATNKSVTFSSTDEDVAVVVESTETPNTITVTAGTVESESTCRIYAVTEEGNKKSYVTVTVEPPATEETTEGES